MTCGKARDERVTVHARFNEHFHAPPRRILTSVELRHCKVVCDTVPAGRNRAASEWMYTLLASAHRVGVMPSSQTVQGLNTFE